MQLEQQETRLGLLWKSEEQRLIESAKARDAEHAQVISTLYDEGKMISQALRVRDEIIAQREAELEAAFLQGGNALKKAESDYQSDVSEQCERHIQQSRRIKREHEADILGLEESSARYNAEVFVAVEAFEVSQQQTMHAQVVAQEQSLAVQKQLLAGLSQAKLEEKDALHESNIRVLMDEAEASIAHRDADIARSNAAHTETHVLYTNLKQHSEQSVAALQQYVLNLQENVRLAEKARLEQDEKILSLQRNLVVMSQCPAQRFNIGDDALPPVNTRVFDEPMYEVIPDFPFDGDEKHPFRIAVGPNDGVSPVAMAPDAGLCASQHTIPTGAGGTGWMPSLEGATHNPPPPFLQATVTCTRTKVQSVKTERESKGATSIGDGHGDGSDPPPFGDPNGNQGNDGDDPN